MATTAVEVRVERHAGVFVSGDASGVVPLSLRSGSMPPPVAAVGNGAPELTVVREEGTLSRVSSARARIAVTVFEP